MAIFYQAAVKETINGTPTEVVYDLAPGNYYGTCTSQAANQNKAVSVSSDQYFILKKGILLAVKFDADNTYNATTSAPVKLNVNSTGNVQIYAKNTATLEGTNPTYFGKTNYVNYYIYDGTYWIWAGSSTDENSSYNPQTLGFGYGTCSTAASTTAKTATLTGYNLITNGIVAVKFTNAVPADATLNVNSKGAKNIWYKGANIVADVIKAGDIATFIYDGTRYQIISIDSGNGLPDEVITYQQFLQKTDAEKATYTGYIKGWPGANGAPAGSYWTDNVLCSIGDTTVTITDSRIKADSAIDPYAQTNSGNPVNIVSVVTTAGQAVVTFDELEEAANIKLNVIDADLDNQAIWSSAVNAAVGATSVTITDDSITTSSIIKVYSQNSAGTPIGYSNIAITTGQVVVSFDALESVASFRARIFNL